MYEYSSNDVQVNDSQDSIETIEVDVQANQNGNGNVYVIDGVQKKILTLEIGNTYTFTHPSNHPIGLSITIDGTHGGGSEYTNGVSTSNSMITIEVTSSAPENLHYYCKIHPGMGGTINITSNAAQQPEETPAEDGQRLNYNQNNSRITCYNTWKSLEFNRRSIVPSNSRPLTNKTLVTKCGIFNNDISKDVTLTTHLNYNHSRKPSANRTACPPNAGKTNLDYKNGSYIKFRPNPIKHWRRQLFPNQNIATNSRITISSLERPGGRNIMRVQNTKEERGITNTIITNSNTGCKVLKDEQSVDGIERENELNTLHIKDNNPQCISEYIPNIESAALKNARCRTNRIRNVSTILETSHFSSKSYLQSRVKKYEQNLTIDFKNPVSKECKINPTTYNCTKFTSLYSNFSKHKFTNAEELCNEAYKVRYSLFCDLSANHCPPDKSKCNRIVNYAPSNQRFNNQGAVSSRLHTSNQSREARTCNIIRSINRFGFQQLKVNQLPNNSPKYIDENCRPPENLSRRMASGGTGNRFICGDQVDNRPIIPSLNGDILITNET